MEQQFTDKIPDFGPWNNGSSLKISNLTGGSTDRDLGLTALAQRDGFSSPREADTWLRSQNLMFHHNVDGVSLELVPSALNRGINHSGGASVLRNWNPSVAGPYGVTTTGTAWDVFRANRIAGVGGYFGIAGMAYGAYVDYSSLHSQIEISGQTGNYSNSAAEAVRIAGGWTGALALGDAGAEVGATIGIVGGPVGVVVGGLIGGAIGGAIGYWGVSGAVTDVTHADTLP